MRKILLVMGVVTTLLSPVLSAWGQEASQPFSDVDQFNKYYKAITYMKAKGVIQGYEDGTFKPFQMVNRAEALKIILLGSNKEIPETTDSLPFPDTGTGAWYTPYISTGMQLGIVNGYPDGTFKPERTVNKVESLKMLLKTNTITPPEVSLQDTSLYEDTPINEQTLWYQPYVFYAHRTNIVDPDTIFSFAPDYPMSRGRVVEMMYRLSYIQENHIERFDTSQTGIASYYGDSFNGLGTSSGDTFSNEDFSAAHVSLPFNTFVEVINTTSGVSVITRVNDRGPYVENRVIDLSQSSFAAIEGLSRGLANVRIHPLGALPNIKKTYIATDTFLDTTTNQAGVLLDKKMPNVFVENESYTLTGSVPQQAETVTAVITSKDTNKKVYIQRPTKEGRFSLPLLFQQAGQYALNIIPDTAGIGFADIVVTKEQYFADKTFLPNLNSPQNLSIFTTEGKTVLSWQKNGNTVFRIHFTQDDKEITITANNSNMFEIPYELFTDFAPHENVNVFIEGAVSSTDFSIDRYTVWKRSASITFLATTHEYEIYKRDLVTLQPFNQFTNQDTITMGGVTKTALEKDAWVTLPSGDVEKIQIAGGDIAPNTSFSFSVPHTMKGTYIVEINNTNGEAVLNYPFYESNDIPLIPNMRDIENNNQPISSFTLSTERNKLLRTINTERQKLGIRPLSFSSAANNLAQTRSDDMAVRNYFSHVTPDGKTIEDLQEDYGLTGTIGENIAKDNNPSIALYGLLRSPAHRYLMINDAFSTVGIGLKKASDGQIILTQVLH